MAMNTLRRFAATRTPKTHFLGKTFEANEAFRLLDVGSGNHSPSKTKLLFPNCEYHGLDLNLTYAYDAADKEALDAFYEMDLTLLQFESIPDDYFDFIRMVHVIEHLHNGEEVLFGLSKKLKVGGLIYLEYPGKRSTRLPSMRGSLNFYDDKSHVRVYDHQSLGMGLKQWGFDIISSGMRRSWAYIFAIPLRVMAALLRGRAVQGNVFWDLLGFAEFVFARKRAGRQ